MRQAADVQFFESPSPDGPGWDGHMRSGKRNKARGDTGGDHWISTEPSSRRPLKFLPVPANSSPFHSARVSLAFGFQALAANIAAQPEA